MTCPRSLDLAAKAIILAGLVVAVVLLLTGDTKNAMLGLAGSALFGLAMLISERPSQSHPSGGGK